MAKKTKKEAVIEEMTEEQLQELIEKDRPKEESFLDNLDKPREKLGFEDEDEDEDFDLSDDFGDEEGIDNSNPTLEDTTETDEAAFIMLMSLIDSSRAMGLSLYASGSMDSVDKYIYYKDWKDPKHKPFLNAGRIVSKKYPVSALNFVPEITILLGFAISTYALYRVAKAEKIELAAEKQRAVAPQPKQETPIRSIKKMV